MLAAQQDFRGIAQLCLTLWHPERAWFYLLFFRQHVSWLPQPSQPCIYTAASEAVSQQ